MSEENIRKAFSKNLKHYLEVNDKQPVDIVNDLKIPFSTVSNWTSGKKLPRMGKVELLAQYLGVEKSDLLEEKPEEQDSYYIDNEARELANFLHANPEYKVLFDASRKVKPEDIDLVRQLIDKMSE